VLFASSVLLSFPSILRADSPVLDLFYWKWTPTPPMDLNRAFDLLARWPRVGSVLALSPLMLGANLPVNAWHDRTVTHIVTSPAKSLKVTTRATFLSPLQISSFRVNFDSA
jgi:hypothetical protein